MAKVFYNGKNRYSCQGVKLFHGENEVEDRALSSALTNFYFLERVKNGLIKIEKEKELKQDDNLLDGLEAYELNKSNK